MNTLTCKPVKNIMPVIYAYFFIITCSPDLFYFNIQYSTDI